MKQESYRRKRGYNVNKLRILIFIAITLIELNRYLFTCPSPLFVVEYTNILQKKSFLFESGLRDHNALSSSNAAPFPIDIVYTWVDGRDKNWKKGFNESARKYGIRIDDDISNVRYEDLDELKYSLRSVEKNIKWYNKVYIVTANQRPKWINEDHPKLAFVNHSEIFPDGIEMPSYSSNAIESVLHNIPGLSEHFIYFNDDFFIGQPLPYTFFFTHDGKPIMLYVKWHWKNLTRQVRIAKGIRKRNDMGGVQYELVTIYTSWLIERHFGKTPKVYASHYPYPFTKTLFHEVEQIWPDDFNRTRSLRFRDYRNVLIQLLILQYGIFTNKIDTRLANDNNTKLYMIDTYVKAIHLPDNPGIFPQTLCINTDKVYFKGTVKKWMNKVWPQPSSYEKKNSTNIL